MSDPKLPDLASAWKQQKPFPNGVVQDLFDAAVLKRAASEFPAADDARWQRYSNDKENKLAIRDTRDFPACGAILHMLSSQSFIDNVLKQMTGIEGLIANTLGGGLHMIVRDGFLKIHADFNFNEELQGYRRLNVLLFLNDGWHAGWGGQLELHDEHGTVYRKIDPLMNRLVVFETSDKSFHGHPHPLRCSEYNARKSLALYYYTKEKPDGFTAPHSTIWLEDIKK